MHEQYLSKVLALTSITLDWNTEKLAKAVDILPLESIIDHHAQTLSVTNWCLQGVHLLRAEVKHSDVAVAQGVLEACFDEDRGEYASHPAETPDAAAPLAAASLAFTCPALRLRPAFTTKWQTLHAQILEALTHPLPTLQDMNSLSEIYSLVCSLFLTRCTQQIRGNHRREAKQSGWMHGSLWRALFSELERTRLIEYTRRCQDLEVGGFSAFPGAESHGGHTFCAVSLLASLEALECIQDVSALEKWIISRHGPNGGFNGRSRKPTDACYSFWLGAAWINLGRHLWDLPVGGNESIRFLLSCVSHETGGLSKSPQITYSPRRVEQSFAPLLGGFSEECTICDPFHTYFGLCAISLFVHTHRGDRDPPLCEIPNELCNIDSAFAIPLVYTT